ncbi:MAG: hypothetical protein ACO280_12900, partial [Pseudohongiellaceae bacterium]
MIRSRHLTLHAVLAAALLAGCEPPASAPEAGNSVPAAAGAGAAAAPSPSSTSTTVPCLTLSPSFTFSSFTTPPWDDGISI